jgi:predicted nucleic acid-binding Zn finger protein
MTSHSKPALSVMRHGAGWWVSASRSGVYFVELTASTVRCTCPAFVWTRTRLPGGECKHIKAVRDAEGVVDVAC